jgi:hypothetical protein
MAKSLAKPINKGAVTLVHSTPAPQSVVDRISGLVLTDLEEHYRRYGHEIIQQIFETNPLAYFNAIIQLAKITRIDLNATVHIPKPKSINEILDRVEAQTGASGRAAFTKFLEKVKPSHEKD